MSHHEDELKDWRYVLQNKPDQAKSIINRLKDKMRRVRTSDPFHFNRVISRVVQGVETPQDYEVRY